VLPPGSELHLTSDTLQEIDEYIDVTAPQKKFFKLWNQFVSQVTDNITLPPDELPNLCLQFVEAHALELREEEGMEEELICHLTNLFDEVFLGKIHITEIMSTYSKLVDTRQSQRVTIESDA
jgi:hypothetical protein